jgi:hypothetical protein
MSDLSNEELEFLELSIGSKLHRNKLGHGGGGGVRHVRTPAGAQFYDLPIGAVITADVINKKNAEHAAQGLTPPAGALTPEKVTAIHPAEVVNKAGGNSPNLPGKGGGKNGTPGGGGPGAPGNGGSGNGGDGPHLPGAAAGGEEPKPLKTIKPTIKGPNKFTTGGVEYSAPKDSRIFRATAAPDAMAYVMEPNGKLHAFNQNGEIVIPPIVDKVLTEKFGKGFKGDEHYLEDAFSGTATDLASETKAGDVLSDESGPQFTQTANGEWQHNQLGSLHDHADLQKHVDSGDLTLGTGSNKTESGESLADMDKPALKKFLKKLPEGQHLEHTDKAGKVTQIVKSPEGGFVTAKGEPVGDSTLFLLRDKLAVVNDADSPVKGASKKKLDKLKDKLAAPAKPKAEKKIPADAEPDLIEEPKAEKKVPEAAKPEAKDVEKKVPAETPKAEEPSGPKKALDAGLITQEEHDKEVAKTAAPKKPAIVVDTDNTLAATPKAEEPKKDLAPGDKLNLDNFDQVKVGHHIKSTATKKVFEKNEDGTYKTDKGNVDFAKQAKAQIDKGGFEYHGADKHSQAEQDEAVQKWVKGLGQNAHSLSEGNQSDDYKKMVGTLNWMLDKKGTETDTPLYRGMRGSGRSGIDFSKLNEGDELPLEMRSWTDKKDVAEKFAAKGSDSTPVVLHLDGKKKSLHVGGYSEVDDEGEHLVKGQFKVSKVEENEAGHKVVHLEQIDTTPGEKKIANAPMSKAPKKAAETEGANPPAEPPKDVTPAPAAEEPEPAKKAEVAKVDEPKAQSVQGFEDGQEISFADWDDLHPGDHITETGKYGPKEFVVRPDHKVESVSGVHKVLAKENFFFKGQAKNPLHYKMTDAKKYDPANPPKVDEGGPIENLGNGDELTLAQLKKLPSNAAVFTDSGKYAKSFSKYVKVEHADGTATTAVEQKQTYYPDELATENPHFESFHPNFPPKPKDEIQAGIKESIENYQKKAAEETAALTPGKLLEFKHMIHLAVGTEASTSYAQENGILAQEPWRKVAENKWRNVLEDGSLGDKVRSNKAMVLGKLIKHGDAPAAEVEKVDAPEANTPDVPAEPPVDTPTGGGGPEGPKYPAGSKIDSTTALRDLKPGAKLNSHYTQPSGSGNFESDHLFHKGDDGAFYHDGGAFKPQSLDELKQNWGSGSHDLSLVEDNEGGHAEAYHHGDPISSEWVDSSHPGNSIDLMSTSGGTPKVEKHLVKKSSSMWESEDGLTFMSDQGVKNEAWHAKVGIDHSLAGNGPDAPDETDKALADGDALINEIQNDPNPDPVEAAVADLAPVDHAAEFKALKVGDPIKGVEQLDAAPIGAGIHYHQVKDPEKGPTLWHKIPTDEDGKDFQHGDGTKIKGKHLAKSLEKDPNKLTLAHHAPESDEPKLPAALEGFDQPAMVDASQLAPGKAYEPGDVAKAVVGDKLHFGDSPENAGFWEKNDENSWHSSTSGTSITDAHMENLLGTHPDMSWNLPEEFDHEDPVEQAVAGLEPNELQVGDIVTHADQMQPGDIYEHTVSGQKMVVNPDGTLVGPGQHSEFVKQGWIDAGKIKLWSKAPTDEELGLEEDQANETGQNWEDGLIGAQIVPDAPKKDLIPVKAGDTLTPDHAPMKNGTIFESSKAPGVKFMQVAGGYTFHDTPDAHPMPQSHIDENIAEGNVLKVISVPDHEHPEFQLPGYGELVMHKANVEKAIVALENHPHFSPKYGLKAVPDNDVTKNLDDFNKLAQAKYPKPVKPKQALINFLKDSIGVEHKPAIEVDPLDLDATNKVTLKQKDGDKEFTHAQIQHAIKALEDAPGVQVKSILAKADSPLAELDQHQLIGFIKDKPEQKAKYIDFLKKKIGAVDEADVQSLDNEIDVPTQAAEDELPKFGEVITAGQFDKLAPEKGHLLHVKDDLELNDVGYAQKGKTFENTGFGSWKAEDGTVKGNDLMAYMANKGSLTYIGKNGGNAAPQESTPVPDVPAPAVDTPNANGIVKPQPGEMMTADHLFALEPGDQFKNIADMVYTVASDPNKVITPEGTELEKLDFEQGAKNGIYDYVGKKDTAGAAAAAADAHVIHAKEELAGYPVGSKFVKNGYAITKSTNLSVKVNTPGSEQTYLIGSLPDSLFAAGDFHAVNEFPATHAAYAWNPSAPEITNPEHAALADGQIAVGKYSTATGKAYMVVHADGTGVHVSPTGVAKAIDADKVKSLHAAGMNVHQGIPADNEYPHPPAADAVAAAAPKKPSGKELIPDGVFYDSSNGTTISVDFDKVHVTPAGGGDAVEKGQGAFKAKFLKGQITDQWGTSILPKSNYGPAKVFGSDTNTVEAMHMKNVLGKLVESVNDFQFSINAVVSDVAAATGASIPNDENTKLAIFLQHNGLYIPGALLGQRAQSLFGTDTPFNRLQALHATLEGMLQGVEVADHPTTGAAKHFDWDALGHAKMPKSLVDNYTGYNVPNSDAVKMVQAMDNGFAGGGIIGQHLGKLSKNDKMQWMHAYSIGDFSSMYELEAKAATAQGKPHASNVLHPGHPLNKDTHKVQWAAAVDGEIPGDLKVPGEWTEAHKPQKADEIDNYLIAAHMAHPEHLTLDERHEWVKSHKNDQKLNVDKLSLKAEARKASGDAPLTEKPKWTENLSPAKSYDVVFSHNGQHPVNWSAYSTQYAVDYAKDHIGDADFKKSVNEFADFLYPYDSGLAADVKNDPLYMLTPGQFPTLVTNHFQSKLDEEHAKSLIPVYALDTEMPIETESAHPVFAVWNKNNHAQKYVFKPSPDGSAYRAEVEKLGTDLGQLFGFSSADTKIETFQGKTGIMQNRHDVAFDLKNHQLHTLTTKQLKQLAQEQVLDWMIGNDDSKGDNILVRKDDVVVGIDKGRAFRRYGEWKGLSTKSSDLNTNAIGGTVWARLNDAIRQGKISKETAGEMYFAAVQKAKRIQMADKKKIQDLLDAGLKNRDNYKGKQDSPKAAVEKIFWDRRDALVDDVTKMWKTLFQEAEYGDLPELPKHPMGEIHSGIHDERHHEVVLKVGVHGKSTNVLSAGSIKGGKLHSYQITAQDGSKLIQHDFQVTEETMKEHALPFLTSTGAGPQSQPVLTETDPVLPDHKTKLSDKLQAAAQTVSSHAADEEYNAAKLAGLEEARQHINGDLQFVKDGHTEGLDTSHFPSGSVVEKAHLEQYVQALEHYSKQVDKVDEAKANHVKTKRDDFKPFVPAKYAPGNLAYFNPTTNEKYTALANGKWLHYQNGKVEQVDDLTGIGSLDGWTKLEKPAEQAPAPTNYTITFGAASQESGELQKDGTLKLTGGTFGPGQLWDGNQYTVTLDTGEKILVNDHDKTSTDWINQGRVRVQMPNATSSGDISAAWDRVTPVLQQMGINLQEATVASHEADYWKLMSHFATKFNLGAKMADSKIGTAAKKKAAWKKVRDAINERLTQNGMQYEPQNYTSNAKFEDLDRLSKTFPSVEEEAEWYRGIYRDAFGANVIDPFVAGEKFLPKYDHVDHHHPDEETGFGYHDRFDVAPEDYEGGRLLSHKFWNGDPDAGPLGKSGWVAATQARMRLLGKPIKGWSSDADQSANSASGIFTRWQDKVQDFSGAYFPAKYGMRAEAYSFNNDNCGSWLALHNMSYPDPLFLHGAPTGPAGLHGGNETVVPDVLPLWEAEFIVLKGEAARQKLIQELKEIGIEKIQGAPLEDRIFLRSKAAAAIAKLKEKWGLKWQG